MKGHGQCRGLALYAMVGDIEWSKWVLLIVTVVFEGIWALWGVDVVCHGGRYRMAKVGFLIVAVVFEGTWAV